jgi:hypothetical protein
LISHCSISVKINYTFKVNESPFNDIDVASWSKTRGIVDHIRNMESGYLYSYRFVTPNSFKHIVFPFQLYFLYHTIPCDNVTVPI